MSNDNVMSNISVCASCGIAEVDDIKLKECANCGLVRYCSDECKQDHKPHHEEACKERVTELRDELLFKQPESSHLGDCPICMIPLPLDRSKSIMKSCCSKSICIGCHHANKMREMEASLDRSCPFCREPLPTTDADVDKQRMKRIEANDPVEMTQWGREQYDKGDYSSAFEYYTKAAQLGDVISHNRLGLMYLNGRGVEKDKGKAMHHLKEAAIGGHPNARYNLGVHEWNNENNERAVKHWIISANLGDDGSIKLLMNVFREEDGMMSKDDLAAALRAHQAAVDATKSPQRDAAEEHY